MQMTMSKLAPLAGIVAVGGVAGATVATLTPTTDESTLTKVAGGIAAVGLVGGFALMRASGRMQDGGIAAALLGAVGFGGGMLAGGAALGSLLVDRSN